MGKLSRVELERLIEPEEEPPLSKTCRWYSGRNLILDKHIRIEPIRHPHYDEPSKQWAIWGYKWHKSVRKWSDRTELFHCCDFELEDEPI
jgi:hypothetical protein